MNSVTVGTGRTTCETSHVVVAADAWMQLLVEELEETLTPWRVIVGDFRPKNRNQFAADSFPVFSIEDEQQSCYGGPTTGTSGFKFSLVDNLEGIADPNNFDLQLAKKECERLRTVLHKNAQRYFPEGTKSIRQLKTYVVTHTSDQDFIVDYLPSDPNIVVGARFSEKGFRFSYLMGELLTDLVTESSSAVDIDLFDIDRFQTMPR